MKPMPAGARAEHTLRVTEAMTVDFEEDDPRLGRLHPVYATYWLVKHLELVSRKLILPYLEAGDEGIGFEVAARHLSPALPGMQLTFSSTLVRHEGRRIYARCEAHSELGDRIGEGTTTQVVLPREMLEGNFTALRRRWEEHRDQADRAL